MGLRVVGHDPERDAPLASSARRASIAPGMGAPLRTRTAVGIEDEAANAAERVVQVGPAVIGPMVGWPTATDVRRPRWDCSMARRRSSSASRTTTRSPGDRPGTPRRGRGGRVLVRREPDREARPPARRVDRIHIRRAVRRRVRRGHRARVRALGRDPSVARRPRPRARIRASRGPRGRASSTRRATGSRSRSTSPPTRSSRSPARHGRSSGAGPRS